MKKILFNDRFGLTQAVLKGRKTMTRRIIKDKYGLYKDLAKCNKRYIHKDNTMRIDFGNMVERRVDLPYKIGEVVAVAQRYKELAEQLLQNGFVGENIDYQIHFKNHKGWTNKMFVQSDLMPHQIRITNIKVERLQDISDIDCAKEGVRYFIDYRQEKNARFYIDVIPNYRPGKMITYDCVKDAFAALIDKVSGKGTWNSNPWVFVYEFELVK